MNTCVISQLEDMSQQYKIRASPFIPPIFRTIYIEMSEVNRKRAIGFLFLRVHNYLQKCETIFRYALLFAERFDIAPHILRTLSGYDFSSHFDDVIVSFGRNKVPKLQELPLIIKIFMGISTQVATLFMPHLIDAANQLKNGDFDWINMYVNNLETIPLHHFKSEILVEDDLTTENAMEYIKTGAIVEQYRDVIMDNDDMCFKKEPIYDYDDSDDETSDLTKIEEEYEPSDDSSESQDSDVDVTGSDHETDYVIETKSTDIPSTWLSNDTQDVVRYTQGTVAGDDSPSSTDIPSTVVDRYLAGDDSPSLFDGKQLVLTANEHIVSIIADQLDVKMPGGATSEDYNEAECEFLKSLNYEKSGVIIKA